MSLFSLLNRSALTAAIRAPFTKQYPGGAAVAANRVNATLVPNPGIRDNGYEELFYNAAGTDVITGTGVDSSDNFNLSEETYQPMRKTVKFNLATTASLVTQHFFIVPSACRLVGITEIHATAESTATTLTAYIEKLTGTTAPGSGSTVMSGTFNLKATANTLQTATLSMPTTGDSSDPLLQFAAGDRVGIKISAAATELAGVVVCLTFAPETGTKWLVYNLAANGDLVDQTFFVANRDFIVTAAYYVHSTKCSVASTAVQLVHDTSTNAPGAGTDMLTNNTNAGFDCTAAANTVQTGVLVAAQTRLAPGDRLSVDYAGTLTALAGVVLVVVLQATARRKEVTFTLSKNANLGVDQAFFTADRNYQVIAASAVWSVAAGGTSTLQLVRDTLTDAPGAGTDLLQTAWNINGTANTVSSATLLTDSRFLYLMAGDRLSLDFANAAQSSAGLTVTVSLIPV